MSYLEKVIFSVKFLISVIMALAVCYALVFMIMDANIAVGFVELQIEKFGADIAMLVGVVVFVGMFVMASTFRDLEASENQEFDKPFSGDRIVRHR